MAASDTNNAPSWLFSFVDLAFLSLIAMTQLSSAVDKAAPDLGELVVPRIGEKATSKLSSGADELWQLRVYPLVEDGDLPYALVPADSEQGTEDAPPLRFGVDELRIQLGQFMLEDREKPLLAPHRDSRSQDLLDAAALIEEFWPNRRKVLVARHVSES